METFARAAAAALAAVALAGCHETLTQLEPQLNPPAGEAAPGLAAALPGLSAIVAGDTLHATHPWIAERLIAAAEEALAATEVPGGETAPDASRPGGAGGAEERGRARELVRWAKAALAAGDHARAVQRGYYACRLLGALPG